MFDRARDAKVRQGASAWLGEQVEHHGDALPRNVLTEGFLLDGLRVPLVGPQGIFKPQASARSSALDHHGTERPLRLRVWQRRAAAVPLSWHRPGSSRQSETARRHGASPASHPLPRGRARVMRNVLVVRTPMRRCIVPSMQLATGTVVDGKVVVEGDPLPEGAAVTIIASEADEPFEVPPELEAQLLESIAQAGRGETISADELLERLRRIA